MKKKKSVHLRRIRERSYNKVFKKNINFFFKLVHTFIKKKKSLCSFLLCFKAINKVKILKLFKKFGLSKNFKLRKKQESLELIFLYLKKKYINLRFNKYIKAMNVFKKKNLYLHVSYRHFLRLPVRGQRTRTNAKTRKHYAII